MPWEVAQCAAGGDEGIREDRQFVVGCTFLNNSSSSPEKIASEWRFEGGGSKAGGAPTCAGARAYLPPSREGAEVSLKPFGDTEAKVSG